MASTQIWLVFGIEDVTHTPRGKEKALWRGQSWLQKQPQRRLEKARKGLWLEVSVAVGGELSGEDSECGFSLTPKEGVPELSYQLTQMQKTLKLSAVMHQKLESDTSLQVYANLLEHSIYGLVRGILHPGTCARHCDFQKFTFRLISAIKGSK